MFLYSTHYAALNSFSEALFVWWLHCLVLGRAWVLVHCADLRIDVDCTVQGNLTVACCFEYPIAVIQLVSFLLE